MTTRLLRSMLLGGVALAAIPAAAAAQTAQAASPAPADPAAQPAGEDTTEIVVTGAPDLSGVLQKKDSSTLFGIDKPLVDTPRSITAVSEELLSRYNIKTVYDFTAVAAGTYTGSFFGVPGSIAIRGTVADNYFNGFQGIANYANYPTPVDAASDVEIVRGPPSPIYGSGQVGGFLNLTPKSARGDKTKYVDSVEGVVTSTIGSYKQREATADLAIPITIGDNRGGLALYGKIEDSNSFYRGMSPKSQVGQASFATDIGDKWTLDLSYQYIHSSGYLKNIGWNRVTQDLIDNGNYTAGRPIAQIVAPGAASITTEQYYAQTGGSALLFYAPSIGATVTPNDFTTLDPATVKTVKLSPRTTFLDPGVDINEATAHTGYGSLARSFDDDSVLKLQSFINTLDSDNYQSYGFATRFDATVTEQRLTYSRKDQLGDLLLQSVVGASYRHTKSRDLANLNDFALSEDRRDLSVGPTPDDRFNNPFGVADYAWATDIHSRIADLATFFVADATLGRVALTVGGRLDNYRVKATNTGAEVAGVFVTQKDRSSPFSYNASLSYKAPIATVYATYARAKSLQSTQGGSIDPATVESGAYVGGSKLAEIGIKTSQLGGRLYASLDAYTQQRSYLATPPTGERSVSAVRSRGIEAELRYLVTRSFGVTGTATYQKVRQLPTDGAGTFITVPAYLAGIPGTSGYGGYVFSNTNYLGLTDGYTLRTTPRFSSSVFATYDARGKWGLTGGVTYNSRTGGFLPGSIVLPRYALVKAGVYGVVGPVRIDVNVDNLFDKLYFMANSDTDANANVLPGVGRTVHVKATYRF
ncbi:TonB-dependent siderophore receptor [Sphingomonas arantia]|uniref:TonB-dependent siderophore receptor n=1 Tax=Sphingomonas arantia TaxID=1460676 RepID=A0ABW4U0R5_9SPHN